MSDAPAPIQHQTKAELALHFLREEILSGALKPEERLTPAALAKRLGTSIVPIREALMRLEREGLVESSPYRGMRVSPVSIADMSELFSVRAVLEGHAVRLAGINNHELLAQRLEPIHTELTKAAAKKDYSRLSEANWRFHRTILGMAHNSHLERLLEDIWAKCSRYRAGFRLIKGRDIAVQREHVKIIEAIRSGDPAAMEEACRKHILKAGDEMRIYLEAEQPGQPTP